VVNRSTQTACVIVETLRIPPTAVTPLGGCKVWFPVNLKGMPARVRIRNFVVGDYPGRPR